MLEKVPKGFLIFMILITLVLTACSSSSQAAAKSTGGKISATWITPKQDGDSVVLSLAQIKKSVLIHFLIDTAEGEMPFMAYQYGGKTYVRADICVPCRSYEYSLYKDILICVTCGTQFEAKTGKGIIGNCVRYPKAEVAWELKGDKMFLKTAALEKAFLDTLEPGLP